jgi:predicted alpha/beta-hydrolase family hydrolase
MPPKRRQAADPASAPEPKRRVTRSSTKATAPAPAESQQAKPTTSKPSNCASIGGKKSKVATDKSQHENARTATETAADSADTSTPTNVTPLSITSSLVKTPIQCALYASISPFVGTRGPFSTTLLIFTHGAGGTLQAPAVKNFCTGLSTYRSILAFQGSMNLGSRVKGFHASIAYVKEQWSEGQKEFRGKKAGFSRLLLGGRSMGARAAVIAASEALQASEAVQGGDQVWVVRLILVSYPLKGPKDVRDQILLDLPESVSVLFVIGEKDDMCPLDLLDAVRGNMKAESQVVVVRGADHGMHVKPARKEGEVGEETGLMAAKWLAGDLKDEVTYIGEEG